MRRSLFAESIPMPHSEEELYSNLANEESVESTDTSTEQNETQTDEEETLSRRRKSSSRDSASKQKERSRESHAKGDSKSKDPAIVKKRRVRKSKKSLISSSRVKSKEKEKKAKKVAHIADDSAFVNKVRGFMISSNRPFASNDVVLHFRSEIGKTQMSRILNTLVEEKSIYFKTYNKTQVYCAVQDHVDMDVSALNDLDIKIEEIKTEISELKEESERIKKELQTLNEYPDDDMLQRKIIAMETEIENDKRRLEEIGSNVVDEKDMKNVDQDIRKLELELKKRGRVLKTVIESLCEGTGMKKSDMLADIGI